MLDLFILVLYFILYRLIYLFLLNQIKWKHKKIKKLSIWHILKYKNQIKQSTEN